MKSAIESIQRDIIWPMDEIGGESKSSNSNTVKALKNKIKDLNKQIVDLTNEVLRLNSYIDGLEENTDNFFSNMQE